MPPIDHDLTEAIPRQPSDTGPLPALACPRAGPCPAADSVTARRNLSWRRVSAAALVLARVGLVLLGVALAEAAWWLGRIAWLIWAWR